MDNKEGVIELLNFLFPAHLGMTVIHRIVVLKNQLTEL